MCWNYAELTVTCPVLHRWTSGAAALNQLNNMDKSFNSLQLSHIIEFLFTPW